jgi:AcrR family transcriptional regulator
MVASVMKASGLTVGGFCKHFRSKEELFAEAIAQAFSDSEKVYSSLQNVPREKRWKNVVRLYLSLEHRDHPDTGCQSQLWRRRLPRQTYRQEAIDATKKRVMRGLLPVAFIIDPLVHSHDVCVRHRAAIWAKSAMSF